MLYPSPLRYPGGKRKLSNFVKGIVALNGLNDLYVEPYAGGAAVALSLLYEEYVLSIHLNDLNHSIYAFWECALTRTDQLCKRIKDTPVTMEEWHRQQAVQSASDPDPLDLGFSTFFLNRTNHSGIIHGGVIGGIAQAGKWTLDARFNKPNLIERVEKVGRYSGRIKLSNLDAAVLLRNELRHLPEAALVYLDPPYFGKGADLYEDHYQRSDHIEISSLVRSLSCPWLVSYDNKQFIRELYEFSPRIEYDISYSAQARYRGSEVMFFSADLRVPSVSRPACLPKQELRLIELQTTSAGDSPLAVQRAATRSG